MGRPEDHGGDDDAMSESPSMYSDSEYALSGGEGDEGYFDDDASSIESDLGCHPRGRGPVGRSPFSLPRDAEPAQPVYEAWTISLLPGEKDRTRSSRILGFNAVQHFSHLPPRAEVHSIHYYSQDQMARMHMSALDEYHGSHRGHKSGGSGGPTGCLPSLRTFLRRRMGQRKPYDEHIDDRVRGLPKELQSWIERLLDDREYFTSTKYCERQWTVVAITEHLRRRFASTEFTPAHRHRFRWWKDNTRGSRQTEFMFLIMGRETMREPSSGDGITGYTFDNNPWREVDREEQARLETVKARGRSVRDGDRPMTFPAPSLRRRPSTATFRRRDVRHDAEPARITESPAIPFAPPPLPRPQLHPFGRAPPEFTSAPPANAPTFVPCSYPGPGPFGSSCPPPPPLPPLHFPIRRCSPPLPPMARPPVFAPTMMAQRPPPPFSLMQQHNQAPHPPHQHPHPSYYFPPGPPPTRSWPPSPPAYSAASSPPYGHRHQYPSPPPFASGPSPPPLGNPFSAITTPSSMSSIHVPMFGPVPSAAAAGVSPPPPPPPPAAASARPMVTIGGCLVGSWKTSPPSSPTVSELSFTSTSNPLPPRPPIAGEASSSSSSSCVTHSSTPPHSTTATTASKDIHNGGDDGNEKDEKGEAKSLAKEKPFKQGDEPW